MQSFVSINLGSLCLDFLLTRFLFSLMIFWNRVAFQALRGDWAGRSRQLWEGLRKARRHRRCHRSEQGE